MKTKKLGRSWYYLTQMERRSLRWVTIIIGAIRVRKSDIEDDDGRAVVCSQVAQMVAEYRSTWTGLTRGRHLAGMTWRGAVEIDLRRAIEPGGHCATTLTAMGADASPLAADERILVIHAHLVLAADHLAEDDHDGEVWADAARRVLRGAWPGSWRVLVKGLRVEQTVREAITCLHGYTHKRRIQYADGGWGDTPTRFGQPFEWVWARLISTVYRSVETGLRSRR